MSDENKIIINGNEYDYEEWMKDMTTEEINYMLKARYIMAFFQWYPDLWYDVIKPVKGGITLTLQQRVQLRTFARFKNSYVTLPRGGAKTHGNLLGEFHEAIWYSKLFNSMSAETREQSAKIKKEKWNEITTQYPALKEELLEKPQFSKDNAEIKWKNGSITNNLQNSHTVKGLRRHRLRIEESARINNDLFDDALKPVAKTTRMTAGTGQKNPTELQSSIHFFSTTTFKNCSEHIRTNQMIREMCENKGSYVCGADWRMPIQFGMSQKSDIEQEKRSMNPVAFDMNYGMRWVIMPRYIVIYKRNLVNL